MISAPKAGPVKIAVRSENFHAWRSRKDQLASKIIGLGGFVVIAAVLLILFYLLYVVAPLFLPAKMAQSSLAGNASWLKTLPFSCRLKNSNKSLFESLKKVLPSFSVWMVYF